MSPESKRLRSLEGALVLALGILYAFSFRQESAVNGLGRPHELFEQDSRYFILSLAENTPYPFNPQHHLLYHLLTKSAYDRARGIWPAPDPVTLAYRLLKGLAVVSGLGFLAVLVWFLRDLELPIRARLLLLALAGTAVTAWFHFSAIESHSLGLPALALYLLVMARLLRRGQFGGKEQALLLAALVWAALCRADLWRLILLSLPMLALPPVAAHRRRLAGVLGAAAAIALVGSVLIMTVHLGIPLKEVPRVFGHRTDRPSLHRQMCRLANLRSPWIRQMLRATTIYSVLMPIGNDYFTEPLRKMRRYALSTASLTAMLAGWIGWLWHLARRLKERDWFLALLVLHWLAGQVFYTWYNPHEPFLWLLGFLPLLVALAADAARSGGPWHHRGLALAAVLFFFHNARFFCLLYR